MVKRKGLRIFFAVLVTALLSIPSMYWTALPARGGSAPPIPEPSQDFYYNDQAGILSGETKALILTKNAALSASSIQIVVLTADSLPVSGYTQRVEYLRSVMGSWQVGGPQGRGLILALSISDGDYLAVAGEGLQSYFTTDLLKSLLDAQLEPDFAAGAYDSAVSKFIAEAAAGAEAFAASPEGQPASTQPVPEKEKGGLASLPWGVLISLPAAAICAAVFMFYGRTRRRRSSRRRVHRHAPLVTPPRTTVLHRESHTPMVVKTPHRGDGPSRVRKL